MIASMKFSIFFVLMIVTITCFVDLVDTKKVSLKPSYDFPLVENQNSVPVSYTNIYNFG